jgi:threonine synthase
LEKALAEGQVGRDERVVALITGSGLKTPHYLQPAGRAFLVHKDLEEVKRALRG